MATPTFLEAQKRLKYLIGEDGSTGADATTTGETQKSHLNAAIRDIVNSYKFSWNIKTDTLTLSAGQATLSADFNPRWGLEDARIVNSDFGDDYVFSYVPIPDRDISTDHYVYWITYDTASDTYLFHSNQQDGSVAIYYNFVPANLSADDSVVPVPDLEAVAYLAASKHWISDERNEQLAANFRKEADARVQALYIQDLNYGPEYTQGTPIDYESGITRGGRTNADFIGNP